MEKPLFVLSRDDWSLHRKGERDQERHTRKVKEAIRNNLKELVSEEAIITSQGERMVKVPIREMDEPRFRYDYGRQQHVGQGNGGTKAGDVLGRASRNGRQPGQGQEGEPGDQPGVDYYEAEVTVDELAELIFEDLQLPRLQRKQEADMSIDDIRFNDIRRKGMMGNIDKRRTLLESLKRQSLSGGGAGLIKNEDMRFKTWEDIRIPQSNAVVLAMMDTSGSMGSFEKYIARSFYFWMVRFLRTRYERVEVCFLAHDTEAKQVQEEAFFTKGESGGTRCSSVYSLALDLLEREYPGSAYNAYAFHFTDGDNMDSDNALSAELVKQLLLRTNLMGYGEIRRYMRASRLWDSLSAIKQETFSTSVLQEKGDVYRTLKQFFGEGVS